MMRLFILFLSALLSAVMALRARASDGKRIYLPSRVTSQTGEGLHIGSVIMLVHKDGKEYLADSAQVALFEQDVNIYPGTIFNQSIADMAMKRINTDARVKSAGYELYGSNLTSPIIMVINICMLAPGDRLPQLTHHVRKNRIDKVRRQTMVGASLLPWTGRTIQRESQAEQHRLCGCLCRLQ